MQLWNKCTLILKCQFFYFFLYHWEICFDNYNRIFKNKCFHINIYYHWFALQECFIFVRVKYHIKGKVWDANIQWEVHFEQNIHSTCTVKPVRVVTTIKRPPFSCPVIENLIWIELLLRGDLSYKVTFFFVPKVTS
jgi:hypothetical protein